MPDVRLVNALRQDKCRIQGARGRRLIAGVFFALFAGGCSGPPALSRAILPEHERAYVEAISASPESPRRGFLAWRARQRSVAIDEAERQDAALSSTRNPFNANRDRDAVSLGAVIYARHCARCHGEHADGRGPDALPEAPCPDFHSPATRFAVTLHAGAPRAWFARIRDGHGPRVMYPTGESTAMPAFGDQLSNEQIWLVVTYLQSIDVRVPPPDAKQE